MTMSDATRPDDSSQALEDAIRAERMALDAGPNADRNLGALAREVRRTSATSSCSRTGCSRTEQNRR